MRRLRTFAIFPFLGLLVSLLTSFAFWMWGERPAQTMFAISQYRETPVTTEYQAAWTANATAEWPKSPECAFRFESWGVRLLHLMTAAGRFDAEGLSDEEFVTRLQGRSFYNVWILSVGWPFPSFAVHFWQESHGAVSQPYADSGLRVGRLVLPDQIIWKGLVANTGLFALALGLGFFSTRTARHGIRIWRGRCPKCAYPVGTSARCTECGASLPTRALRGRRAP